MRTGTPGIWGLAKAGGKQRTDSTHVMAVVAASGALHGQRPGQEAVATRPGAGTEIDVRRLDGRAGRGVELASPLALSVRRSRFDTRKSPSAA